MSDSKPPTFKLDDDKDVLGRLCALSWFDGVRGEYEPLVNVGEDDARELVAMLSAWLDAPRLAAPSHICVQCQKPAPAPATTCRDHEWIGVDLDGTLAHHDTWRGLEHIGAPVPAMLARVKRWRAKGVGVRILTARVSEEAQAAVARAVIDAWCLEHVGEALPVTCVKDMHMTELWDDRAVTVEKNAGRPVRDPESPTLHAELGVTPKEAARAAMAHGIPCPTCGYWSPAAP